MSVETWMEERANQGSELDFDPERCDCEVDCLGISERCAYCQRFEERE